MDTETETETQPAGVELVDLRPNQCRWAITPHYIRYHRFCAAPTKPGEVYCSHHQKIGTTPPRFRFQARSVDG